MSALGQTATCAPQKVMSPLPPKADMCSAARDVCYGPIADIKLVTLRKECVLTWQRRRSMSGSLDRSECIYKEERLGTFACQFFNPFLQLCDNWEIFVGKIGLLGRVFCDVVEFQSGGQRSTPDQLPITLPHAAAEWLDVVNDLVTRRRLAFADRGPDIDPIKRFSLVCVRSSQPGEGRKHVHDVHDFLDLAGFDLARPIGERYNPSTALIQHSFPATI